MAESYIQLPADGAGKKIRTRTQTVNGQDVHEQAVYRPGIDTWSTWNEGANAASKWHYTLVNTSSTTVVKIRKVFVINVQIAAVTGVVTRFDFWRLGSAANVTTGTAVTPVSMDTANGAFPTGITVRHTATTGATGNQLLFGYMTTSDEVGTVQTLSNATFQQSVNAMPESDTMQDLTLRQNEGFGIQQNGGSTVGTTGFLVVFTTEAI